MKTFNELLERKIEINKQIDFFESYLKKLPKNEIGLIDYKCKKYQCANQGFEHWFKKLQQINLIITTNYKKEIIEYHSQIRNSKIK
jgi:hypothetical protein